MKNRIQIKDIDLDSTSADIIASNLHFDASVKNFTIGAITGTTKLDGTMTKGKIYIDFSPYFKWGFGKKNNPIDGDQRDQFEKKLVAAGLNEADIKSVVKLVEQGFDNISTETSDIEYVEDSKKGIIGGTSCMVSDIVGGADFNIPDIPLNIDMTLDVKDVSINSMTLNTNSQIITDDFKTGKTISSDLDLETTLSLPFQRMEIDQVSTSPIQIPKVDIPDMATSFTMGKVGISDTPISIKSKSGSADISLIKLVDTHPRYKINLSFKVLWFNIGIWIEYGFDLTINLKFKLLVHSMNIALKLKDMVLDSLSFTLKLLKTSVIDATLGALKIGKIIGKRLP